LEGPAAGNYVKKAKKNRKIQKSGARIIQNAAQKKVPPVSRLKEPPGGHETKAIANVFEEERKKIRPKIGRKVGRKGGGAGGPQTCLDGRETDVTTSMEGDGKNETRGPRRGGVGKKGCWRVNEKRGELFGNK